MSDPPVYAERDGDDCIVTIGDVRRRLTARAVRELHAGLVRYLADAPDEHPRTYTGRESPGGDPRLMRGGRERPNRRRPRK